MAPSTVELPTFGGLDLRDDPQDAGASAAVDLVNVDLSRPGVLRTRPGTSLFGTATSATGDGAHAGIAVPFYGTFTQLIAAINYDPGAGTVERWVVFNNSGSMLAATTTAGGSVDYGAAVIGTPGNQRCYVCEGGIRKLSVWNGAAWTEDIANTPAAALLAVQQPDDRLVAANAILAGVGGQDYVYFSNPPAPAGLGPEAWTPNDYVQVTPGDGESIAGLASWRNLVFVFKQSKFFVFYGNSVGGSGSAVFNYRTVDTGVGVVGKGASGGAFAVAGREGVYFLSHDGVYVTTGGAPTKVSAALDPFFLGQTLPLFSNTFTPDTSARYHRLSYAQGKLFVHLSCSSGTAYRTFVYYPDTRQWSLWDTGCSYTVEFSTDGVDAKRSLYLLPFENHVRAQRVLKMSESATTDSGTAISASYRTAWFEPQGGVVRPSDGQRWIRGWRLDGSGSVTLKTAVNDSATLGSGATVALGTAPAVASGYDWRGVAGNNFGVQLSGSAPWSISKLGARVA